MRKVEPVGVKAMGHYMPGIISGNNLFVSGQLPIDPQTVKVFTVGGRAKSLFPKELPTKRFG